MNPKRPLVFWIATLAAVIAAVALLRDILLPFVAGMVLAYLLDAPVNRLERIGMNRAAATLAIVGLFVVAVVAVVVLTAPFIGAEIAAFIENFPANTSDACTSSRPTRAARGCAGSSERDLASPSNRAARSRAWPPAGSPTSCTRCGPAGGR